nr:reverse transcriptase domain-containing protein [Tanacetum cinerariifolium]
MPLKSAPMTQAAIHRMIKDTDAAIATERARQANVKNDASGSGPELSNYKDGLRKLRVFSRSVNVQRARRNNKLEMQGFWKERSESGRAFKVEIVVVREIKGHTRNQCSIKVKQEEVREARGRAYAIKDAEPQGPNVVTSTFLLNNRYAFVLFDSGSDRSFMDTRFSAMLGIDPIK